MYSGTQFRYLFRESMIGLARRKISGTVAVLIMGSALLMLALFSLVTINLDQLLQGVRGDIDITLYLDEGLVEEDRLRLQRDFLATDGIDAVYFVSKEQALDEFRADLGEDADLLAMLESNPLPASFRLRVAEELSRDAEHIDDLARSLGGYPGVDEVVAQVALVRRLDRLAHMFVIVDLVVGVLVLLSALFVISNTVRLTVEERARTVDIMKQVGATNWFIRTPFLLSGAFQGAAAGALAMVLLLMAHRVLAQEVEGIYFFGASQILGFVLLSTLLGGAGSAAALRRYLQL